MAVTTLMPVDEYLASSFQPDCDSVEGRLVERNVGEISHSDAQGRCYFYVMSRCKKFWAGVEVRVQVRHDRFRVADVMIVSGSKPSGRVITQPPYVLVEVLSPEDRMSEMQERIDDYLTFGVPFVWVINPETRRGYIYTTEGSREAKDGILRAGELEVPLTAIFSE